MITTNTLQATILRLRSTLEFIRSYEPAVSVAPNAERQALYQMVARSGAFQGVRESAARALEDIDSRSTPIVCAPLSIVEMVRQMADTGRITGYVQISLHTIISGDIEHFNDRLSQALTETDLLEDIGYEVVAHDHDRLFLKVQGDASTVIISQQGPMPRCDDCDEPLDEQTNYGNTQEPLCGDCANIRNRQEAV